MTTYTRNTVHRIVSSCQPKNTILLCADWCENEPYWWRHSVLSIETIETTIYRKLFGSALDRFPTHKDWLNNEWEVDDFGIEYGATVVNQEGYISNTVIDHKWEWKNVAFEIVDLDDCTPDHLAAIEGKLSRLAKHRHEKAEKEMATTTP